MKHLWVTLCLVAMLLTTAVSVSQGGTYYVATDGVVTNDGSSERPWPSVNHALAQVGGGHTILVKPGIYSPGVMIEEGYQGTSEHPTVIKSETKWDAVLLGGTGRGFDNSTGCEWVTVDGFRITGARSDGVKIVSGDYNVVRNCWIHNSANQGILASGKDLIIENNLVEFNGSHIQSTHGVYASGEGMIVRGNIVRHNAGFGLHLYPVLKKSLVANNVSYGHRSMGIIVACPEGGGGNRIIGNTVVDNGGGISIWKGKGEVVVNNLVVAPEEPLMLQYGTTEVEIHHNLFLTAPQARLLVGTDDDPGFINPRWSDYWLKEGSPAIGKGDPAYAFDTDFWGRPVARDRAPDIGAFAFDPFLETKEAHRTWYGLWPYGGWHTKAIDFWSFPSESK